VLLEPTILAGFVVVSLFLDRGTDLVDIVVDPVEAVLENKDLVGIVGIGVGFVFVLLADVAHTGAGASETEGYLVGRNSEVSTE
jgi:hypothetical protein